MNVRSLNSVTLVGRLGSDPDTGQGPEKKFIRLSIATNTGYYDGEKNWKEDTSWHRVITFGGLIEKASKLKKGDLVSVLGHINYRKFQDKEENDHFECSIIATDIVPLVKNVDKKKEKKS